MLDEQSFRPSGITVFAPGEMGVVGASAALFEERITRPVQHEPPVSPWPGPGILNALPATDILEVLRVLALREIVFLRKIPPAPSLPEALITRIRYYIESLASVDNLY